MFARIAKLALVFQLLFFSCWMVTPVWSAEHKVRAALVIDADSRSQEKAVIGIKQAVEAQANNNLDLRVININNADSGAAINSTDIDYAIVVGVKPTLFTLKTNPTYPVLYSLVPESTYKEIISDRIPAGNLSPEDDYVIYLEQTATRQLALTRLITGKTPRVGVVVGQSSKKRLNDLKLVADETNTSLIMKQTLSEDTAIDDIKQVLMDSDIYLALYDSTILNRHNAKWLLYMAYKMNKPVIGFSSSYTRAGAVASIFSTPEQIGRQSGEWLIDMLKHHSVPEKQNPKYFTVTTNPNIQRMLRLERLSGEEIKQSIQRLEGAVSHD